MEPVLWLQTPPSSQSLGAGPSLWQAGYAASTAALAFLQAGAYSAGLCQVVWTEEGLSVGSGCWWWWGLCISAGLGLGPAEALSALGERTVCTGAGGEAELQVFVLQTGCRNITVTVLSASLIQGAFGWFTLDRVSYKQDLLCWLLLALTGRGAATVCDIM